MNRFLWVLLLFAAIAFAGCSRSAAPGPSDPKAAQKQEPTKQSIELTLPPMAENRR